MPSPTSWKKIVLAAIKIGLSATILGYLYYQAQKEDQFATVAAKQKQWEWLVLAFLLCAMAHVISFYRWKVLVQALNIPFSTLDAFRIGFIGLFFGLFTFGVVGGDTLRVYYAARHAKNRLAEVICTVFADRAIGMLTMFTFATIGFMVVGIEFEEASEPKKIKALRWFFLLISTATVIGWVVVIGFLFAPKLNSSPWFTKLRRMPRVGGIVQQLSEVVLLYRKRLPTLLYCVVLSVCVNLCFVGTIYLIACGIDVVHPPLAKHFLIAPISMAANAVPLPGGMGGMELMLSFFYNALATNSTDSEQGIVVAFSFRFALLTLAVFGAIAWFASRKQIDLVLHEQSSTME